MNNILDITKLRTGDIVLTHTSTPFILDLVSKMIRFFTKSKWAHVKMIIINYNVPFSNQSTVKGVCSIPFKDNINKGDLICILRSKIPFDKVKFAVVANNELGNKNYDYKSLLWYQLILQLTGKWYGPIDEKGNIDRFYCSEYVAWVYNTTIPETFPLWYKTIPEDLYKNSNFSIIFEGKVENIIY